MGREAPLLEMRGMSKSFGSVEAVVSVDLELNRGEILGLVGDNAAGKSTLMKLLTAVHQPDAGQIYVDGKPVRIANPRQARGYGIEMIYQDFSLAPNLSIADNIFLGQEIKRPAAGLSLLDRKAMRAIAREVLQQTHIRVDSVDTPVSDLSGGQQQAVAIGRALAAKAKIIIMDEPTASLSVTAIAPLLEVMKRLRQAGLSIVFITHRIQDIFDTCDRVMVMRRGTCVGVAPIGRTSIDEVTGLITGSREAFGTLPNHAAH
jgi:ABC-type sugar transport system ATPase subunit